MTQESTNSSGISRFFGVLLRLLLVVIIGVLIGGGIFYAVVAGGPALYRAYIQPIESSIARIEGAQTGQSEYNEFLNDRVEGLQARVEAMESQSDGYKQMLSELQSQIDSINATPDTSEGDVKADIENLRQDTETQVAELQTTIDEIVSKIDNLDQAVGDLSSSVDDTEQSLIEMADQMSDQDTPIEALRRELRLVQAMELLTRARMNIAENNIGRATEDITAAQELLTNLESLVPKYQTETVAAINERVGSALEMIPDSPVLAADELEIAWELLRRGLPGEPELQAAPDAAPTEVEATPTPSTSS
jgi:chromosome segregation ATPase